MMGECLDSDTDYTAVLVLIDDPARLSLTLGQFGRHPSR